jgi:hypothetical protein
MNKAIKIGISTLDPPLETFIHGQVALVGDAAHPPLPYLGQGAQQVLEDAGTIALLLKQLCLIKSKDNKASISVTHLQAALKLYDQIRVPRNQEILGKGKSWGAFQQKRAENAKYNKVKEKMIQREVFFHETMPVLLTGVKHDYKEEVMKALDEAPLLAVAEEDEGDDLVAENRYRNERSMSGVVSNVCHKDELHMYTLFYRLYLHRRNSSHTIICIIATTFDFRSIQYS